MVDEKVISLNEQACYLLTLETEGLVDIFIRPVYKQIVVHTLNHFIDTKGFIIYAWCLTPNRLYLVCQAQKEMLLKDIRSGFKKFTTEKIIEALQTETAEKRDWILEKFEDYKGLFGTSRIIHCWKPIQNPLMLDLKRPDLIAEQIQLIHYLPVKDRIVLYPEDYIYSSAIDYDGAQGLVKITKLSAVEQEINAIENRKGSFKVKYNR